MIKFSAQKFATLRTLLNGWKYCGEFWKLYQDGLFIDLMEVGYPKRKEWIFSLMEKDGWIARINPDLTWSETSIIVTDLGKEVATSWGITGTEFKGNSKV